MKSILQAYSDLENEKLALDAIKCSLSSHVSSLNILFVSPDYNLNLISDILSDNFSSNTIACTTSGIISEDGFKEKAIQAISFNRNNFKVELLEIDLDVDLTGEGILNLKHNFDQLLENVSTYRKKSKSFGILLVDGMSIKEEPLVSVVSEFLKGIPLVGGSAGDHLRFDETRTFFDKSFESNKAIVAILTTDVPFEVFKLDHFKSTDKRLVVTEANPNERVVTEIDGYPAADYYAKLLNKDFKDVENLDFSNNPLALKIGNNSFIRSIQTINEDKSLKFYCAIDKGIVLSIADKLDIIEHTDDYFKKMNEKLNGITFTLLFECVLRKIEIENLPEHEKESIINIYKNYNAFGFHTYGEQYSGIHVNQTITGISFGGILCT